MEMETVTIINKATRVDFKFNVKFKNADIQGFDGERMITIPGQPQDSDIHKKILEFIEAEINTYLSNIKLPIDNDKEIEVDVSVGDWRKQGVEVHISTSFRRRHW